MYYSWKLILPVLAGVVLSVVVTRLAFHQPVLRDVLITALVAIVAGVLLSLMLSIRRPKPPVH